MKTKSIAAAAGAAVLAVGVWMTPAALRGQPLYDRLHVELPYKITLGEKVLQPGEYTIQRLPDTGNSRILLFYTNNGMKFETSAMTIPALDQNTARDTKVILNRVGDDFYISKIWVQGKDYGYELPVPKSLKDREKESTETTVAATYQPTQSTTMTATAPTTNATNTNTPPTNTDTTTASTTNTTSAATATEITSPSTAQTVPPAQSTPVTSQTQPPPTTTNTAPTTSATTSTEVAQTTQPSTPSTGTADRSMNPPAPATPAPAEMPATAANWVMMLLGGGTLSGAGMMLRRKR